MFSNKLPKVSDQLIEPAKFIRELQIIDVYVRTLGVVIVHQHLQSSYAVDANQSPLQTIFVTRRSGNLVDCDFDGIAASNNEFFVPDQGSFRMGKLYQYQREVKVNGAFCVNCRCLMSRPTFAGYGPPL